MLKKINNEVCKFQKSSYVTLIDIRHAESATRYNKFPINKHGVQATENVRRINAMFESDVQVMSFPAGLVSRRNKGVIRDVE